MTLTTPTRPEITEVSPQPTPGVRTPRPIRPRRAGSLVVGAVLAATSAVALTVLATTSDDGTGRLTPDGPAAAAPVGAAPSAAVDPHYLDCMHAGAMVADRLEARVLRCRQFSVHLTSCLAGVAATPDVREVWTPICRDRAWAQLT